MLKVAKSVALGVVVCTLGGTIVFTTAWVAVSAIATQDSEHLLMLPAVLPYAFLEVGPFGAAAGLFAGAALALLARTPVRHRSRRDWIVGGTVGGLVAGALCAGLLPGWGSNQDAALTFAILGSGAMAGACCGSLLGCIGWPTDQVPLSRRAGERAVAADEARS